MRNYLSFGGGVNSTAMLLLLLDEGWEFEAVYVDHGAETVANVPEMPLRVFPKMMVMARMKENRGVRHESTAEGSSRGFNDGATGELLGISRRMVTYHKQRALALQEGCHE